MVSEYWCSDCEQQLDELAAAIDRLKEANRVWRQHWEQTIQQQVVGGTRLQIEELDVELLSADEEDEDAPRLQVEPIGHITEFDEVVSAGTYAKTLLPTSLKGIDHVCPDCGKAFTHHKYLRKHRLAVHRDTTAPAFHCIEPHCNKSFKSVESLRTHAKRHGEKLLSCDRCAASFHLKKDMITHWHNVHLKILPFVCESCGRRFKDNYTLRTHSDKNRCTIAVRSSMLSERFPTHRRKPVPPVSTRIPLNCAACSRVCNSPQTLAEHYRTRHPGWDYAGQLAKICAKCYRQFETAAENALHFEAVHNRWPCPICKQPLTCQEALERHMKRHPLDKERPFTCDVCAGQFMSAAMLRTHHRRRHTNDRPFACPVCHKRFAEQPEMRIHQKRHRTDTEPLRCSDCDQQFAYAKLLRQHVLMRHTANFEWFTCELCGDKFINSTMMHAHARVHHPFEFQEG